MHLALDRSIADHYDDNDARHHRQQLQSTIYSNDRNGSDD